MSAQDDFETFCLKKNRKFLPSLHNELTFFGIQANIFQQGCQKKLSKFSIISGHWAKNFRFFVQKFEAGMPQLHSTCLQEQFERKIFLKKTSSVSFIFFGIWAAIFGFLSIFFRWGCRKCILRVHRSTSMKRLSQNFFQFSILRPILTGEQLGLPASVFRHGREKCNLAAGR